VYDVWTTDFVREGGMRGKCLLKYRCKLKNTFSIVENFKIKNKKIKKGEGEVLVTNFRK
jgi:NADH/NAD ratio-sensing transcriptional regulator Rex